MNISQFGLKYAMNFTKEKPFKKGTKCKTMLYGVKSAENRCH